MNIEPISTFTRPISSVKINFLSSGSVASFNVTYINNDLSQFGNVKSLPFGGSLIVNGYISNVNQYFTEIYLITKNGTKLNGSELRIHTGFNNENIILPNNTLLIPQIVDVNTWTWELNVIDLPKFTDRDHGYLDTNIKLAP